MRHGVHQGQGEFADIDGFKVGLGQQDDRRALQQNLPKAAHPALDALEAIGDAAVSLSTAGLESWPEAVIPYSSAVKVLPGQVMNGARQVVSRFSSDAGGSL